MVLPRRSDLQLMLDGLLPEDREAYFQPPTNIQMQYPCIVYDMDDTDVLHANNVPYRVVRRWMVTYITLDKDSPTIEILDALPMCLFNRSYSKDGLHHFVYNLYF